MNVELAMLVIQRQLIQHQREGIVRHPCKGNLRDEQTPKLREYTTPVRVWVIGACHPMDHHDVCMDGCRTLIDRGSERHGTGRREREGHMRNGRANSLVIVQRFVSALRE